MTREIPERMSHAKSTALIIIISTILWAAIIAISWFMAMEFRS